MRTRSRNTPEGTRYGSTSWSCNKYRVSDGVLIGTAGGGSNNVNLGETTEVITDGCGPRSDVHEVNHTKVSRKIDPCGLGSYHDTFYGYRVRTEVSGFYSMWQDMGVTAPLINASHLGVTFPKTTDQLVHEAEVNFLDVNETDNLLNVLEANQTVRSIQSIGSLLTRLSNSLRAYRMDTPAARKRFRKDTEIKTFDELANMHLGWSFGFAPLISDLRKVWRDLPRLKANLRKLARNQNRPHSVMRSCAGSVNFTPDAYSGYQAVTDPVGTGWWHEDLKPIVAPIRIGGVRGRHMVDYKSDSLQMLDYLLSRYIATGPVDLLWEKVKFSFVVDWFVDSQDFIGLLDNSLTGNRKKITGAWSSEKYHYLIPIYKKEYSKWEYPMDGSQIALYELSSYNRKPENIVHSVRESGRFGKKQAGLSASLIYQMIANLRRKR